MPAHQLLTLLSVLSLHGETPRMRRGSVEGPLAQLPAGNTAGRKSLETKPRCGAVCTGVKKDRFGVLLFLCDAALKCGLLREQHMTHAYLVTSNRFHVKG